MDSQQQITHAAQAISTITVEIDALTNQIQPVVDRIKELKKSKKDLKDQIQPMLKSENLQRVNTPAVQIAYKAESLKKPPFNAETVRAAAAEFFRTKNLGLAPSAADEFIVFVEKFRTENKLVSESVSFRKSTDYTSPQVTQVQPMKMVQRPRQSVDNSVQPAEL